jgi:hypothetical protein
MSIVVFWLSQGQPFVQHFDDGQLLAGLSFAEGKRKEKDPQGLPVNNHVVMNSELGDCVSKPGVSDELPQGYDWSKQHRGGPPESGSPPKTLL